jgi:hypothetical protein
MALIKIGYLFLTQIWLCMFWLKWLKILVDVVVI